MKNLKNDFPFFLANPNSIYFDSGATSLKPKVVIDAEVNYLTNISANPHSNDYQQALAANEVLDQTRIKVQKFLNAHDKNEIIFNSGATFGLNFIVNGLKKFLKAEDEVFLTTIEHSSNLLPWIVASKEIGFVIKQIPLTKEFGIDIEQLSSQISEQTKIVSFASISNTVGIFNDTASISQAIKAKNPQVIVVVDATQEVAHRKIDVTNSGVDFLVFSAHKMYGPFGIGVVYGKMDYLKQMDPLTYGGGNNDAIDWPTFNYELSPIPARFEAGTPNISAIAAFSAAIDYITNLGLDNIYQYELELKQHLIQKFIELKLDQTITAYNLNNDGPIFAFNANGYNPQDLATFLAADYHISSRSGAQCARTTEFEVGFKNSVRITFGVYNTIAEIDTLLDALTNLDQIYDHILK